MPSLDSILAQVLITALASAQLTRSTAPPAIDITQIPPDINAGGGNEPGQTFYPDLVGNLMTHQTLGHLC